ncbi:MAG: glycosyltransferase involved in cell wall biosynthesis [Rhodothermales bacterium]|jgi:glycosyltransferase involved in cell wall biosynthesis
MDTDPLQIPSTATAPLVSTSRAGAVSKPAVLLLGKRPPPLTGPAVATGILLASGLKETFRLFHFDTNTHDSLATYQSVSLRRSLKTAGLFGRFALSLVRLRPDVVIIPISQTSSAFFKDSLYILMARVCTSAILVQLRGSALKVWLDDAPFLVRAWFRFVMGRVSDAQVLGESLRYLFEPYFSADRIHVLPNGGDFGKVARKPVAKKLRLLCISNLQPSKGILDLLEAFRQLCVQKPNATELSVVGSWFDVDTKAAAEAVVLQHKLPVQFHGVLDGADKFDQLSRADVFVFLPKKPEGHPWVIVEAMSCGLPIVATDQGAIRESVLHAENGFVLKPSRPDLAAGCLVALTEDAVLRERMGERSRELYESRFTAAHMADRYIRVIEGMVARNHVR